MACQIFYTLHCLPSVLLRIIISWGTNVPVTEGHVSGLRLELADVDVVSHSQSVHIEEPGNDAHGNLLVHYYRKVIIPVSLRVVAHKRNPAGPQTLLDAAHIGCKYHISWAHIHCKWAHIWCKQLTNILAGPHWLPSVSPDRFSRLPSGSRSLWFPKTGIS